MAVTTFVLESTWAEDWDGEVAGESWTDEDAENALTWLTNIGSGAASGAATGAVAGPWGALIGGLVGGGLGAAQTALQQSQQNQQPAQRPPAPAARPAPTPAPAPRPAPAPAPTPPRAAPVRTIAVPRPAPTRPAPTAPAPASGGVSTSDVAHLVTTLAPLLVALGQQLATDPAPAAAPAPEAWEGADVDPWPEGEAVDDGTSALSSYPVEAYDDPAGEAASESDSETECWAAEGEWQQVMA